MNSSTINKIPDDNRSIAVAVETLSSTKLSKAAFEEMSVLAEECLNPDFLEDAGIETLEAVLEDLVERFEIHIVNAKTLLRDARGAINSKGEPAKDLIAETLRFDRALKEGLKATETALENLRNQLA